LPAKVYSKSENKAKNLLESVLSNTSVESSGEAKTQADADHHEADANSGDADGREAARGAHVGTGNEHLQLSRADVKNDVTVSETSGAQKRFPSVDSQQAVAHCFMTCKEVESF